jgi:uncharacterized membrane protein YfcA
MNLDFHYSLAGALTGLLIGLTGVGGGSLMTPILLLFFGVAPTTAVAMDLWFAAITKLVGALIHSGTGKVDWQVVRRLWGGSLPVALLVVVIVAMGGHVARVQWLTTAIGAVILLTAAGMLFAPRLVQAAHSQRLSPPDRLKKYQAPATVGAGAVLGICVALTSAGAGALGSVMLLYLYPLRMTPHRLVATDLLHAIPLALVAGTGYLFAGMVDGAMLLSLLVGSIPSIIIGSFLARRVNGSWLRVFLALALAAVGMKTLA